MSETKHDDENSSTPSGDGDTGDQRGVADEQLPDDLQPTEDNPLARHPGQTGDEEDRIGADRDEDPGRDRPAARGGRRLRQRGRGRRLRGLTRRGQPATAAANCAL